MTRLQTELARLYRPLSAASEGPAGHDLPWIDAQERTRVMVLELCRPADGATLAEIWRSVQTEWEWPAPAMAVSGTDGLQLWFSLAEPTPMAEVAAVLEGLRQHHLAGWAAHRVRQWPGALQGHELPIVPRREESTGHWAAFVAPDLMPLFEDAPWLDIEPSEDGQAQLLAGLHGIRPVQWQAVVARLKPTPSVVSEPLPVVEMTDPRQFLLRVMNDEAVPMALRIEAAKALLPVVTTTGSR